MPQYEPMIFNDDAALLDDDDDDIELNDIQHLMQLQLPMPQYEPMIFNDAVALVDGEGIERNDMNLLIIDDIIPSQNCVNDVIQLPINIHIISRTH